MKRDLSSVVAKNSFSIRNPCSLDHAAHVASMNRFVHHETFDFNAGRHKFHNFLFSANVLLPLLPHTTLRRSASDEVATWDIVLFWV